MMWFFLTLFLIYLTFRLFGRQLVQLAARQLLKRVQRDMQDQHQAYERHYDPGAFRKHVYQDGHVTITAPKEPPQKRVNVQEVAEDVDYEELR
ncbi:MAG: hypothetical protein NW241_00905 [Bacteroidia bacterium]|nr:hypothetical protein [Bacteroidia bacterium]